MRNHKILFTFTVLFFVLGFINIHFSLLGIICMTLPIILLLRTRKKTWCQGYCPRASLYTTLGKSKRWKSLSTPWLTHLSYRFYSMMMTTTLIGLVLAMVYKPRTWCTICPIATVSDVILKK